MDTSDATAIPWSEADSQRFIERGRIYIPSRDEIQQAILDLIPAETDEPFRAVELGVGAGWLSAAILQRFPAAHVLGFDGSPAMLREAEARLQPFAGRFELREFRLQDRSWLEGIDGGTRLFVSSLVLHHLDGPAKQSLYRDLYERLDDGGAVLIADLVAPCGERERGAMARWWDAEVQRQSLALTGSADVYHEFVDEEWNWFAYPDPVDIPSTVPEHVQWLGEAGFSGVDVFWARAGHALYGGYKGRG